MKESRVSGPGFDVEENPDARVEKQSGFKKLKRRERGNKKKSRPRKNTIVPRGLVRELSAAAKSLDKLAVFVEEEINIFRSRFKPVHPSDHLYQEVYEEYFRKLAWYYRRISAGLPRQDLDTLERCFDSVRQCRDVLPRLDVLLLDTRETVPLIESVKQAGLSLYNNRGNPENLKSALDEAREYVNNLSGVNQMEFDQIPPENKSDGVIDAYNKIERLFGDFRRGLDKLERYLEDKSPRDLADGLVETRTAREAIDGMIG